VKGRVVKIGLRATWVKTDSGDIAIISNNYLASGPLVNFTAAQRLEKKLRL
jgi:small-conductance mechanosensitive channel